MSGQSSQPTAARSANNSWSGSLHQSTVHAYGCLYPRGDRKFFCPGSPAFHLAPVGTGSYSAPIIWASERRPHRCSGARAELWEGRRKRRRGVGAGPRRWRRRGWVGVPRGSASDLMLRKRAWGKGCRRGEESLAFLQPGNPPGKCEEPGPQMGPEGRGAPLTWRSVGEIRKGTAGSERGPRRGRDSLDSGRVPGRKEGWRTAGRATPEIWRGRVGELSSLELSGLGRLVAKETRLRLGGERIWKGWYCIDSTLVIRQKVCSYWVEEWDFGILDFNWRPLE